MHEVSETAVNELIVYSGKSRMTLQRREKLSVEAKATLAQHYPGYSERRIHEEWVDFVMKGRSSKLDASSTNEDTANLAGDGASKDEL